MNQEWVLSIKEQCEKQGSAFFFKQWSTWGMDKVKRGKKAMAACCLAGHGVTIRRKQWQVRHFL